MKILYYTLRREKGMIAIIRINKTIIILIIISMMPCFSISGSAATDNLSDVIGIINNSVLMCVNSPMYLAKGQKIEYTTYPQIAGQDIIVDAGVVATALGGSITVAGSLFSITCGGVTATGIIGQNTIAIDGVGYSLSSANQKKNGTVFVSSTMFSYCNQAVYKSVSSGIVVIGSSVTVSLDERLTGLFGVYVSADGSDLNSGAPLFPVSTLAKARDIVRIKHATIGSNVYGTMVYIHGGTYRYTNKVSFNSADYSTTYKSFGDGDVHFKGSVELNKDDFTTVTDPSVLEKLPIAARGKVKEVDITPKIGAAQSYIPPNGPMNVIASYYELFVNQSLQTLARWPNDDYTKTGTIINDGTTTGKPMFTYETGRQNGWTGAQHALLMGYWGEDWACQPIVLDAIDTVNKTITLNKAPTYTIRPNARYYAFNLIEELDTPGEWYIDKNTNKMYYYPVDDFYNSSIELSFNSNELVEIDGTSDITFEGITFENNRATAIKVNNSQNIMIKNCTIRHIGQMGIRIDNGKNVQVQSCDIYDIGGIGVYLNGGTRISLIAGEHKVENCHIYNFGRLYRTYAGGIDIFGVGNVVRNNSLHDAPHLAIRFSGNDHLIEYNEIYNAVRETKDAGAVYCGRDWTMRGVQIRYNYLHDILSNMSAGTGTDAEAIYLDDMYSGVNVFGNVIVRANRAALIGGGRDNIFSNNIIIDNTRGLFYDDRATFGRWAHNSTLPGGAVYINLMSILNNPSYNQSLWYGKYPQLAGLVQEVAEQEAEPTNPAKDAGIPKGATVSNNVFIGNNVNNSGYENVYSAVRLYGTIENNRKYTSISGLGFVDHENQNYKLNSNSIIYSALPSFQPIPFENIGIKRTVDMKDISPQLRYPKNDSTVTSSDINFSWHKRSGADKYRLIVSQNFDLSSPIFDEEINTCSKQLEGFAQGRYYFRVDGINTSNVLGKTSVGSISSFRVSNQLLINFDGLANGTNVEDIPGFEVTYTNRASNDSATIENGTLKIVKDHSVANSVMEIKLSNYARQGSGIEVEYKIRFERTTQGAWLPAVEGLKDTAFQTYVISNITDNNEYKVRYGLENLYSPIISNLGNNPNEWTKVKCVIYPKSDKYSVYIDDVPVPSATLLPIGYDINQIGDMLFKLFTTSVTNVQDVYYIDDIKIKTITEIFPTEFTPAGGNISAAARTGIFSIDFNTELNVQSVNSSTVVLEKNGVNIPVTVECVDNDGVKQRITVTPVVPLSSATNYVIRLKEGIISAGGASLANEFTYSFFTEHAIIINALPTVLDKNGRKITSFSPSVKYTAKLYFKNPSLEISQSTDVILALKDAEGKLVSIWNEKITILPNTSYTYTKEITTPPETVAGWKMYCYLWEDITKMSPLYMWKIVLP